MWRARSCPSSSAAQSGHTLGVDTSTNPKREYPFGDPDRGGTIATGVIYGAIGTLLVFVFFHGVWVPVMLAGGYALTAAVCYFLLGPRWIWFEGPNLVEESREGKTVFPVTDIKEVDGSYVPKVGVKLFIVGKGGLGIAHVSVGPESEAWRMELGRRLTKLGMLSVVEHNRMRELLGITQGDRRSPWQRPTQQS